MNIYESSMSTSISKVIDGRLIVAEISAFSPDMLMPYLDLCEDEKLKDKLLECMNNASETYFFNRLNVPEVLRKNNYGAQLLNEVLGYCDKKDIFLLNVAHDSGQMGRENLVDFYVKNGMTLVHKEGLLVYHKTLRANTSKNVLLSKIKS